MLDRLAQPRTWLVLGLLVVLAIVVYAVATSGGDDTTLAASVEVPTPVVEADEPLLSEKCPRPMWRPPSRLRPRV